MRKIHWKYIVCCAVMFCTSGLSAQQTLRLTQTECREMALANNEKLKQSDNALHQAELDRQIAKTSFLPSFDGSATGIYGVPDTEIGETMKLQMRGTYMAGIAKETATEQNRMTRMDVLVEADNAYWTYIAVRQKVKMMSSYHRQMDTLYNQTRAAVETGMATENDLLRIEAKRTEIHYQMQKVENGADLCRLSLCQVIGVDFSTQIEAVDTVLTASEPDKLVSDIYERPELNLLEKQVSAGKEQIKMARSEMLPTVALTGNYMYYGNLNLKGMADDGSGTMVPFKQEYRDGMWMAMLSEYEEDTQSASGTP